MRKAVLALSIAMTILSAVRGYSSASSVKPEIYGFPPRLTTLLDLGPIHTRTDLTPIDKTGILIVWLEQERNQPTPALKGLGGGDINSSYIQAQIVKTLAQEGDPLALREIAADKDYEPAIRDGARIALGLMTDISQVAALVGILENQEEPYFRVGAAQALGSLGAQAAIPALQRSLQDSYTVTGSGCTPPRMSTIFPVRDAAQTALRILAMQTAELRTRMAQKRARFEQRLDAARAVARRRVAR